MKYRLATMIVSFTTHPGGLDLAQGYGTAGFNIVTALQRLGHQVPFNLASAPVNLNFTQPYYYEFNEGQYTVGYTPWESSKLHDGWAETMNRCDEVWTTSDLCKKWFEEDGVTKPVHVYEHGIDHIWSAKLRQPSDKIKFLHVGEPAPRKCGQMLVDIWDETFKDNPNVSLTIKSMGHQTTRIYKGPGLLFTPDMYFPNCSLITKNFELPDLVDLYHDHDVLIYPSYGEGFGFIPLQAAATGMPVIMNHSWAPYRSLITGPEILDRAGASPWPDVHPGDMLWPDKESLRAGMLEAIDNIVTLRNQAYEVAPTVHSEYDWESVTGRAFKHIFEKFS